MGNLATTSFSFTFAFFTTAQPALADACDVSTRPGNICECNLRDLRPLQGAIGMAEVQVKADAIKKDREGEWLDLKTNPIKVLRGPEGQLFVTDHHHGARAWIAAGEPMGECKLQCDLSSLKPDKFWAVLADHALARLKNKNGKSITPQEMPNSMSELKNDPYRSLAFFVRKDHAICRPKMKQKEFAEFEWADWYRNKAELPAKAVEAAPQAFVSKAKELATASPNDRPDGHQDGGATCPNEEERALDCSALQ